MRMAYEQAGWSPGDVDLIECHATGTPLGDAVEVESLKSLWGEAGWKDGQCVIGSVKGNIGHAAHGGRRGRVAQGSPGPEASRVSADGELRAARTRPGIGAIARSAS